MGLLKKIRDFLGIEIPSLDQGISQERENEIIEKIAKAIVRLGLGYPGYFLTSSLYPVSSYVSQIFIYPWAPLLEFLGIKAYEYAAFLNKRENIKRLMDRIEELMKEEGSLRT
jgi:hypothetical protein